MTDEAYKRKLTAILSADVAGYSRLMGENEAATVSTLKSHRTLISEKVLAQQGRVIDSPGDNILAEFSSIVDAVSCAVDIQKGLREANEALPTDRKMVFRIGVNLGDVIYDDDRIYGDGVNIAARVESLSKPGEVAISETAFDNVRNKLKFGFEFLGEHQVKNISQPIRAYQVLTDPADSGKLIGEPEGDKSATPKTMLAVAVVIFILGAVYFYTAHRSANNFSAPEKAKQGGVGTPSIAVLPFTNMSEDPKQEYFSDGITEDLITDLSKISGLLVVARNSTFTYKGAPVNVKKVGEDLGVIYVLEGSVRRAGDKVRINAQLIDADTGIHLWAERFDGTFGDIFALQDKFTRKIVAALSLKLTNDEREKLTLKYTDNVEAYDAYLKGREQLNFGSAEGLASAVEFFEQAVALDSDYSSAYAGLAQAYRTSIDRRWTKELGWTDARALAKKYLQLAMQNPTPYVLYNVAKSSLYQRQFEEAVAAAEQAITLDPNYSDGYLMMGYVLTYAGQSGEAIDYFKRAMRLDPQNIGACLYLLGLAQYLQKQYEEAVTTLEKSQKLAPNYGPWPLAISYAQLNRGQEAGEILHRYIEKRGWETVPIENTFRFWPFKEQKDLDHWADGLRKSGLMRPENPVYRRDYQKAIADAEQAIILNPEDAHAQYMMGESLVYSGRSAEAIDYLTKAMRLNEEYPPYYMFTLGLAQFCLERYEDAARSLETAFYKRKMHRNPVKWLIVATYAHMGRLQEAEDELRKYMKERKYNDYTVERVLKYHLHALKSQKDTERFSQGLHKAGLPMR